MKPAETTRSGLKTLDRCGSAPTSQVARSGKSAGSTTAVGTPAAFARSQRRRLRPGRLTHRGDPRTRPGPAAASSRACSRVPEPETRTTTRPLGAGTGGSRRSRSETIALVSTAPTTAGEAPVLRRRMQTQALLVIGLVIVGQLPLPFRMAGLAFCLAAIWMAVLCLRSLSRLRRRGDRVRGQVGVSLGLGIAVAMLLNLLAQLAYYPVLVELEECQAGANTGTARQACEQRSRQRIEQVIDRFERMISPA